MEGTCEKKEDKEVDQGYLEYQENKGLIDGLFEPKNTIPLLIGLILYSILCVGIPIFIIIVISMYNRGYLAWERNIFSSRGGRAERYLSIMDNLMIEESIYLE